jgi:hypothetical protein
MATVIVEQFHPVNGYWNKLYEVDQADFDFDAPITVDKYGGHYRTRIVGEEVIEEIAKEIVEDIKEVEEIVKPKVKSKSKFGRNSFKSSSADIGEID